MCFQRLREEGCMGPFPDASFPSSVGVGRAVQGASNLEAETLPGVLFKWIILGGWWGHTQLCSGFIPDSA